MAVVTPVDDLSDLKPIIHSSTLVDQGKLNGVGIWWNDFTACWILRLNVCWATNAHFCVNIEMANKEMLLSLCAAGVVALITRRRPKRRKKRKTWTEEWLENRTSFGAFCSLLAELRNLDVSSYRNFLRMDVTSVEKLLQLIRPVIMRQETNMRGIIYTIPVGLRKRQ